MKNVTIYSTPSCHFCHLAKEFFKEKGVAFVDYDVSRDETRRNEMMQKSGQMGVPVIVVGDDMIIGFDQAKLESLLEIA